MFRCGIFSGFFFQVMLFCESSELPTLCDLVYIYEQRFVLDVKYLQLQQTVVCPIVSVLAKWQRYFSTSSAATDRVSIG
jgi:hypothetical protein